MGPRCASDSAKGLWKTDQLYLDLVGRSTLVEQSEASTAEQVVETMGDTAYCDSGIRQDYADAGSTVVAVVPHPTAIISPTKTSSLTWRRDAVPVRRDRQLAEWYQW